MVQRKGLVEAACPYKMVAGRDAKPAGVLVRAPYVLRPAGTMVQGDRSVGGAPKAECTQSDIHNPEHETGVRNQPAVGWPEQGVGAEPAGCSHLAGDSSHETFGLEGV